MPDELPTGPPAFAELATSPDPPLDQLALALAAEFRTVDAERALATLDRLGADVARAVARTDHTPLAEARACADVLGGEYALVGDRDHYDDPENSMLDVVLERRRGLPILLSTIYAEAGRRAGLPLAGIGLPGHFVVGHFGTAPPVVLDPFGGGQLIDVSEAGPLLRPWPATEIAMRMLNNLVGSYQRRGDLAAALRAARMRLRLPASDGVRTALKAELRALEARLN